ncbi:MAG: O-antigen ligase family protein [Actinobacteria bacterium]|nr:O-antigen ligase family protein [Actinomycetota bacterium]
MGLINLACFVIGVMTPLSELLDRVSVGGLSPLLGLASALAMLGWWRGVRDRTIIRYFGWATLFTTAAVISGVAAGPRSFGSSLDLAWWMLVLIPGLAVVVSDTKARRALLAGLLSGAAVYLAVSTARVLQGAEPIDRASGELNRRLLGQNRFAVDRAVVWLVPLMLVRNGFPLARTARWVYVIGAVIWTAASQGRTGAIGLVLGPLVVAILAVGREERRSQKRVLMLAAVVAVLFVALSNVSIPGFGASERLENVAAGDLNSSDELRILLLKKSTALAMAHPFLGVGWGESFTAYDPIVETAKTPRIRQGALTTHPHNAFVEVWANSGTFALIGWIGALAVPLLAAFRRAQFPEVRALAAGFAVIMVGIAFHSSFGSDLYLVITVLLGAVADPRYALPDET